MARRKENMFGFNNHNLLKQKFCFRNMVKRE